MQKFLCKSTFITLIILGVTSIALAEEDKMNDTANVTSSVTASDTANVTANDAANYKIFTLGDMQWNNGPDALPKGAKIAVLEGDPSKEGPYTIRVQFPAHYTVPPHFHNGIEHVTVISGDFNLGMGDHLDKKNVKLLSAGSFAFIAPEHHHFGFTDNGAIIQLHGMGPWTITYIDPKDDPRKSA